jgi:hypothetical protein
VDVGLVLCNTLDQILFSCCDLIGRIPTGMIFVLKKISLYSDYMVESGASWNFEPWVEEDVCSGIGHILHSLYVSISLGLNLITLMFFSQVVDKEKRKQEAREMGILDALKEMRSMKVRSGYLPILRSLVKMYLYMHVKC